MTIRQQISALIICFFLLVIIVELVRRRKLREDYSWLWLIIGIIIFFLVIWPGLLQFITDAMGIVAPTSTVFFLGIIFLILVDINSAVKLSDLNNQVKTLAQKLAILESDAEEKLKSKTDS